MRQPWEDELDKTFAPEVVLEHGERAELTQTVSTPGWRHIQRLLRSQVDQLAMDLINTRPEAEAEILAKHKLAKAAAVLFAGLASRVNEEAFQYRNLPQRDETPIDPTAHLLDLGERYEHEVLGGGDEE